MRPLLTSEGSFPRQASDPAEAMVRAVEFQQRHGLQLITDGEQRDDMLSLYGTLPGVQVTGGIPRIVDRIRPPEDPAQFPKIRDLDFLRARFPDVRFRVNLTAPTTFAFACASTGAGPAYKSAVDPRLHDDLAEAIRTIAREVGRRGVDLQIDDPMLSQGMRDYGPSLGRIDAIAGELPRDRMTLHTCGGLARAKVLDALLRIENVATLNLAFAGRLERDNVGLLDRAAWVDRDILLGAGSIPVQVIRPEEVATPSQVTDVLRAIVERMGEDRIRYVLPDCGFRATAAEFVPSILDSLVKGFETAFPRA